MKTAAVAIKMKYPLQDIMDIAYKYCYGDQDMAHEIVLNKIPYMHGHKPQKSHSLLISRILGCSKQHIQDAQKKKNPETAKRYACQCETNAYCNDPIAEIEACLDFERFLKDTHSNRTIMQYLQAGYTQVQTAKKLNVSPAYICMTVSKIQSKYLRWRHKTPMSMGGKNSYPNQEETNVPSSTNTVQK